MKVIENKMQISFYILFFDCYGKREKIIKEKKRENFRVNKIQPPIMIVFVLIIG